MQGLQQVCKLFCSFFPANDWLQVGACWHTYHETQLLAVTEDELKMLIRAAMLCDQEA